MGATHTVFLHEIGIQKVGTNICRRNHINNWWHLCACANYRFVRRELFNENVGYLDLKFAKIVIDSELRNFRFSSAIRRKIEKNFHQDQLSFGLETIHKNNFFPK